MNELADACIMRTQVLAGSVCELSAANKSLMEILTQQSSALNETVRQVQYLSGSARQIRTSMDQGGWIDNYITELGQHTANLNQRLDRLEEGFDRLNDTVRDVAIENQPRHVDQKLKNRFDGQQAKNGTMGSKGHRSAQKGPGG